jgi:hypothetical protein
MLERTKARALPMLNASAEHAPMVTTCCNACRTCVSTNLLGLGMAGIAGAAVGVRRLARRFIASPS